MLYAAIDRRSGEREKKRTESHAIVEYCTKSRVYWAQSYVLTVAGMYPPASVPVCVQLTPGSAARPWHW